MTSSVRTLVSYNSDSESNETQEGPIAKRQKIDIKQPVSPTSKLDKKTPENRDRPQNSVLPPLPSSFHNLYATNTRTSTIDDPSLHGGRKRQIPHVEGHWPSHIYLEWRPTTHDQKILGGIVLAAQASRSALPGSFEGKDAAATAVHTLLESPLSTPQPLHISLSRTLSLKTEQRESFLATLRKATQTHQRPNLSSFLLSFGDTAWYPNHEGNRWFLALQAKNSVGNELNALLHVCNCVSREFGFGLLYEGDGHDEGDGTEAERDEGDTEHAVDEVKDRSKFFHVSLAWALEGPDGCRVNNERSQEGVAMKLEPEVQKKVEEMRVYFESVKVKIGNAIHDIRLGEGPTKCPS